MLEKRGLGCGFGKVVVISVSGKQEFDCGFGKQGLSSTKQKLSLSQEAELMAYFDEQKVKALELEMEVKRVDNLIENGVRDLYKL